MTPEFFGLNLKVERKKKKKSTTQNENKAAGPVLWLKAAEDSGANFSKLGLALEPGSGPMEVSEADRGNPGRGAEP